MVPSATGLPLKDYDPWESHLANQSLFKMRRLLHHSIHAQARSRPQIHSVIYICIYTFLKNKALDNLNVNN